MVFDLDGVLVDSADAHRESWRLLAGEEGRSLPERVFQDTFGRRNEDIVPLLFGAMPADRSRALAERKEALYRELVRPEPPIADGAVELVCALHGHGALLAIGSSAPRANIDLILSAMNATTLFRAIVSADDVTCGKPDPQVFRLACEFLGLPPSKCVVIEDAPAGVQAAKAAGAKCVGLPRHHSRDDLTKAGADLVVGSLRDLTVAGLAAGLDGR